jgi:hypothetical protein
MTVPCWERALDKANELGEKIDASALSPVMQKIAAPALPTAAKSG